MQKGEGKEKWRNQREGISEYRVKWKGKRKKGDTFADTILFRGVEKEGKESRGGIVVSRQGEGRGTRREGATSGGRRSTDVKSWGNKKSHPYSLTRGGRAAWLIKACDNKRREGILPWLEGSRGEPRGLDAAPRRLLFPSYSLSRYLSRTKRSRRIKIKSQNQRRFHPLRGKNDFPRVGLPIEEMEIEKERGKRRKEAPSSE